MRHGLSASLVLVSFVRQLYCRTGLLENGVLRIRKKRMTQLGAPGAVKPHSGHAVVVPLPLFPWYLQSVVMYAWYWSRDFVRDGVGAALLRVLRTCQAVLL